MVRVKDIADAIEKFAPRALQESYDNTGLQVGHSNMKVSAVLVCLDITEEVVEEAIRRKCNLIVSHHPLIFKGLKHLTGATVSERVIERAIKENIALYASHTNLDSTFEGVSYEMATILGLSDLKVLEPRQDGSGLGVIGEIPTTPTIEFLRKVKKKFNVKCLRFSDEAARLVVRKVALCGGAGVSLCGKAIEEGADVFITGDVKYHDFTTYGQDIVLVDIGHYESELCSRNILARVILRNFTDFPVFISESDINPVKFLE
ncbi:MAG: Nif3-like dinuclear metal center hexameric protein [Muribaculaceae bacterium]|nr:Nif3-like dinuclear metal center hexameric protein [Muribaculaceae bacterium]